jgi:LacI family repressor for deo operon, udp, cdd, tsx, nupC, and nupG
MASVWSCVTYKVVVPSRFWIFDSDVRICPRSFASRLDSGSSMRNAFGLPDDPSLDMDGGFTVAGGQSAMSSLLAGALRPTAVFAASDEMAFGAMRALRKSGLRVPEDVSLIGFDDHETADLLDLTTVAQPLFAQGERAARMLIARLAGEPVPEGPVILPTELIIRGSTAPLRTT